MAIKFRKVLAAACATTMISTAAYADELRIDRLFVAGDSLSDGGTYSQASRDELGAANSPNIRYRFTDNYANGSSRTYAEGVADRLGIRLDPSIINGVPDENDPRFANSRRLNGTNFAQGGSRVSLQPGVRSHPDGGVSTIPVADQIGGYTDSFGRRVPGLIERAGGSFNERDLVVVWGGNNDVLFNYGAIAQGLPVVPAAPGSPSAVGAMTQAADDMAAQIKKLKDAGATKLVVVTIPDIGANTPFGVQQQANRPRTATTPGGGDVVTLLVDTFNNRLAQGIEGENVAIVNSDRLLQHVLDNPARYGFSPNTATFNQRATIECPFAAEARTCIRGGVNNNALNDGQQRVFADGVHPTTQAHELFADAAHSGVIASAQIGAIPVATLGAIRQSAIGLENRLNLGAIYVTDEETGESVPRPVGDFEVYGGAELGSFSSDAQQVLPGFDAQAQILKLAFDVPVAPKVVLGAGISLDHGQLDYDDGRGGFNSRLFIGAVFGVAELFRGIYVNGALAYGHIDVHDIDRNFKAGASSESYSGKADGKYYSGKIGVGAMVPLGGGFLINPSVGFTHEHVGIDGFTESSNNGGVLDREYGDTEITSNRGTLALAGFYRPPAAKNWVFGVRGSYEYDFTDDDLVVASREAPLAGYSTTELASFSAPRPDRDFSFLSATITHEFNEHSSVTLGGSTVLFLDGVDGYEGSLIYKHKF